jgi:ergothioneine biosynthesis protein EgtB
MPLTNALGEPLTGIAEHRLHTLPDASADIGALSELYRRTRAKTLAIAAPLSAEDQVIQSMPDASPTKWHLAHTTWFFETFLLAPSMPGYSHFDSRYAYLFNSYYESVGPRHPRPHRGLLTRPSVSEIGLYREHVDQAMDDLFTASPASLNSQCLSLVALGINHEQQHQELMLTDILHAFSCNPLRPAHSVVSVAPTPPHCRSRAHHPKWHVYPAGMYELGHSGDGFAFDNEGPRHRIYLRSFRLAAEPVTNREWQAFIDDGGYQRPELWLSDGWATVQAEGWRAPLYWESDADDTLTMTLSGPQPIDLAAPVCHVSYYEADAFARWAGKRLPTEAEWEVAASALPARGNTLGTRALRPLPASDNTSAGPRQMFGDVWEWTCSPYVPYPGYRPPAGAVGEYNGKFMCNQMVLRGGSCATPDGHIRASYRNFFYPHQRWQFFGLRLAEDV